MRRFDNIREYAEMARTGDYHHDQIYVFYSAEFGNMKKVAGEFAQRFGGKTLEMTDIGRQLDSERLYGESIRNRQEHIHPDQVNLPWKPAEAKEVFDIASQKYAEAARGRVIAFIDPNKDKTFLTIELPALLKNENVESINGISRKDLSVAFELERDRAEGRGLKPADATVEGLKAAAAEIVQPMIESAREISQRLNLYEPSVAMKID